MAEIKSTLDLIMEKTKGLTLSPKEKEEIQHEEWLKKAKGWVQKFLDGWVEMDKVKSELFSKEAPTGWKKILQREIIGPMDPEEDPEKRLQLISELLEVPLGPFLKIMKGFNQKVEREKIRLSDQSIKRLSDQRISGSAVLPNLDRDPSWIRFMDQEKKSLKENLIDL